MAVLDDLQVWSGIDLDRLLLAVPLLEAAIGRLVPAPLGRGRASIGIGRVLRLTRGEPDERLIDRAGPRSGARMAVLRSAPLR